MKITNLECPSCGGRLKPMEGNPRIMICEYCNSQFMMEDNVTVNYHIHQSPSGQGGQSTETPSSKGPLAVGILTAVCFLLIITISPAVSKNRNTSSAPSFSAANTGYLNTDSQAAASDALSNGVQTGRSPLYQSMVEAIFEKDAGLVSETELQKIKYLKVHTGLGFSTVEYSLQDPYGETDFEALTLQLESLEWDSRDLSCFTGLQKLDASDEPIGYVPLEELPQLRGLICHGVTPEDIAGRLSAPEQLLELSLDRPEGLEGIAAFENLQALSIENIYAPDLKQLVSLKNLKSLSIQEKDDSDPFSDSEPSSLTDYSALSVLTGLEKLEIESPFIRDLNFVKPLTRLDSFTLSESEAISLAPLESLAQLSCLKLEGNNSLQDYGPVGNLTSLRTLFLDKGTSQPDPDLSSLQQLENLDISGFLSISFLNRMGNLRHLSIHSCNIDEINALSGLTNLESLTCYSVWTYSVPLRDVRFIDGMANLKSLDFSGGSEDSGWGGYQYYTQIMGDISNVFNHSGLEELVLNNCMFSIEFDKLQENPSLKRLEMKEVELKENFYVESYNGMTDIWYDDVSLDANIDFLSHYPGLEELSLDGNQLTNIRFAASLHNLERLSINNNYVTDLSPLHQAKNLKFLDIRMNPVTSTIETDGSITVLK